MNTMSKIKQQEVLQSPIGRPIHCSTKSHYWPPDVALSISFPAICFYIAPSTLSTLWPLPPFLVDWTIHGIGLF